jgi:nucleoside-diphosphate-sugar epimerase
MKVLVTGAQGFLGTEVVSQMLKLGHKVFGVDLKPGLGSVSIDVCSKDFEEYMIETSPDVVVHLAGVQYGRPVKKRYRNEFFEANVTMAKSISEAAQKLPSLKQIIYVSTDMVYGRVSQTPVPTTASTSPVGPYGASKLFAEETFRRLADKVGLTLTIFRPRLIAGDGRLGTIAVLKFFIQHGLPVPIFGRGENRYQMVSKSDVANAIALALLGRKSGTFNLGSNNPPQVKELISYVIAELGSRSLKVFIPNGLLIGLLKAADHLNFSPLSPEQFEIAGLEYVLDTSITKTSLGWEPTKSDQQILVESLGK